MEKKMPLVIIINGPTASGKTALALALARHFKTSIISADSRQCFKELNIGVAKPSDEELQEIKHYFIDSHSIQDTVTAQTFEAYALNAVGEIFSSNKIAIVAGGTGLYIKAFCEGFDVIPQINPLIRDKIKSSYKEFGLEWLQNEIMIKDPGFWKQAEQQNPQRLMRALEVVMSTGNSITSFRTQTQKQRNFKIIKIGINLSKEQLHRNINFRVDKLMEEGLAGEVKSLISYKDLNALQTVGYTELFSYFSGKIDLNDAIEQIKRNTRQYAKRQMTWFKKDKEIQWFNQHSSFEISNAFLSAFAALIGK